MACCTLLSVAVNKDIFHCWLNGVHVDQAVSVKRSCNGNADDDKTAASLYRNFILCQYRQFEMMEHFLHRPLSFIAHSNHSQTGGGAAAAAAGEYNSGIVSAAITFSLSEPVKISLLNMYYGFDEAVMRELLCFKKIAVRSRKEFEEISMKCRVPVGSCRRQLDNLRRIIKKVSEDQMDRASLVLRIQSLFHLSQELASKYGRIIFLINNKIDITRKRLLMYSFSDFEYCASIFMQHWCMLNGEREEFDGQLAQNARDIRLLLTSNKDIMDELRQITTKNIQIILPNQSNNFGKIGPFTFGFLAALIPGSAVATESSAQPPTQSTSTEGNTGSNTPTVQTNFPSQFKQIVRTMAALGSGLLQPKEIRDLIVDIVEKIVEPCSNFGWRSAEVDCFFTAIGDAWGELTCLPAEQIKSLQTSWDRLVLGTKLVSLRLFNEVFAALSIQ